LIFIVNLLFVFLYIKYNTFFLFENKIISFKRFLILAVSKTIFE